MGNSKAKEGELSEEDAAVARKFLIALAFLAVAVLILILEVFVPIQYVVFGVSVLGTIGVVYYHLTHRIIKR